MLVNGTVVEQVPRVVVKHRSLCLSVVHSTARLTPLIHVGVGVITGSLEVLVEHGPRVVVEHVVDSCLFACGGKNC